MSNLKLTPIDSVTSKNLTVVRHDVNCEWKTVALISAAVSILLITIGPIIVFKRSKHSSTDALIITTISMETSSNKDITRDVTEENKEQSSITSTRLPDSNSSLSIFNVSETPVGFSLSHSLYFNMASLSDFQGYVTNVTLRLFTNWEGNDPLYIFALKQISLRSAEIIHRYPVIPQTNNTQWQTIDIPFGEFPISTGYLIGVGMQDRSDTNQIFAVNSVISFYDVDITNDTRDINLKVNFFQGIAFDYTAVKNEN